MALVQYTTGRNGTNCSSQLLLALILKGKVQFTTVIGISINKRKTYEGIIHCKLLLKNSN